MRDLRSFCWQRIWDLLIFFNATTHNPNITQICISSRVYANSGWTYWIYTFHVFVFAQGALRDLRYFLLTKNLGLVKNFQCSRTQTSCLQNSNIKKSYQMCRILCIFMSNQWLNLWISTFHVFCFCTRSSARSQIIFFDKESESC